MQIRKTGVALGATISTLGSLVSIANADSTSTSVSVPSNVASLTSGDKNFISSVKIDSASSGTFVGKNIVVTTASNFLHMVDGKPQLIGDENTTHRVTTQTGTTYEFKNKDVHFLDKDKFGEGSQYDVAVVVIPGFERTSVGTELPTSATNPTNGQKVSAFGTGANGFEALVEKPISNLTQTPAGTLVSYQEGKPGMQGGGLFDANGNLIGMHLSTTTGASHDGLIFNQSQLDKIKEIANTNTPASTVTTTKAIVSVYEADPELEGGKQRIANEGVAEVVDGTGRVVTPGQPKVIKVGTKGSTTRVEKDFSVSYEDDPTLPLGENRVKIPGVKGYTETVVTYTFDKTSNKVTRSEMVNKVDPVNEVVLRGINPNVGRTNEPTKPVETPKVETPKVEEPTKPVETPKVEEPTKPVETPKVEEPTKPVETPKVEEPTKPVETPKVETPKVENPTKPVETPKVDTPKVENPTKPVETPKVETPKVEEPTKPVETPKAEEPTKPVETSKVETPKVENPTKSIETPKVEPPKVENPTKSIETPKVDTPKVESPTKPVETPKVDTPKVESPTKPVETPKVESPTKPVETPKVENPTKSIETPKVEPPKVENPTKSIETPKVEPPKVEEPTKSIETPKVETPKVEKPTKVSRTDDGVIRYTSQQETQTGKNLPKTGMGAEFGLVGLLMSAVGVIGLKKRRK